MSKLSSNQLQEYNNNGYIAPIDILSKDEAFQIRKEIENIETKWPDELKGVGRNYAHMISPSVNVKSSIS
jgi:non-haem Fe2+, alpha-ketoglutarate-dependent halogenase